jgi:hypothetical protein
MIETGSGQQSRLTANNKLQFKVIAEDACGTLSYRLEAFDQGSQPYLNGHKIKLKRSPDWYEITFHLIDKAGYQVEFDPSESMCAHVGVSCPATGSGIATDQLTVTDFKPNKLEVLNKNQDPPRDIGFILCFIDGKSKAPLPPFDPIMNNDGGGHI